VVKSASEILMKKIGKYIVRGLLGKGGMSRVYKVELPPIDKIAALKLLDPDELLGQLMGYDKLRAAFIREAVTMAGLRHPNIIAIHDFDESEGQPYYVMDFFANNLGTVMGESYQIEDRSRIIHPEKALDYLDQTLSGLCCLHDAGILHRDIKPFNLLITDRDTVKICDFGLSRLRGETFSGPSNLNVGSPYYAAPEQEADPDDVDVRADLYPLGIMFYRMLTGRLPDIEGHMSAYTPPSGSNPDLDPSWDDFTAQAIARHRDQRFTSAKVMRTALNELKAHWYRQKEKSCATGPTAVNQTHATGQPVGSNLRRNPIKWDPHTAAIQLNLDSLWRPKNYMNNRFELHDHTTITDHSTGLTWQQSGSQYPRTWRQAHDYISRLNAEQFGGQQNWRLPTADELVTLLKPSPQGRSLCIAPMFDATQRWIWSADRRSFLSAYYVDVELGFVGWQDFSAPFYVRAVRVLNP
jgi:serine/threonine protein kinase